MSDVNIRIRDDDELLDPEEKQRRLDDFATGDYNRRETFLNVEMEKRRWKNRRRMAWIALASMLLLTLFLLFAPIESSRIKVIAEPIIWFYFSMASIIGAYMGFTTWASRK